MSMSIFKPTALHLIMSPSVDYFAVKPVKDEQDYNMLRQIFKFNIDGPGNIMLDVLYMMCTDINKTHLLDTDSIIGNPRYSFVAHLPSATNVYSKMSKMDAQASVQATAISFFENDNFNNVLDRADTLAKCRKMIGTMVKDEVKQLKVMLFHDRWRMFLDGSQEKIYLNSC